MSIQTELLLGSSLGRVEGSMVAMVRHYMENTSTESVEKVRWRDFVGKLKGEKKEGMENEVMSNEGT